MGHWGRSSHHCSLVEKAASSDSQRFDTPSGGKSELAGLEVVGLLLGLKGELLGLEGGQVAAEGTGLLLAEIMGSVLLSLELLTGSGDTLLGEDGEDTGDVLSHGLRWISVLLNLHGSC